MTQQPMRVKACCAYLSFRDLRRWDACTDVSVKWSVRHENFSVQIPSKLDNHFLDPLKGSKAESTFPSPGFDHRICGMEA
ncbi:hypothetical protein TNCV_4101991 [Trichonephila clavipes]|nr:hypothetical protein TNCV_4101991 [Trichonephila clavipes]